MEKTVNDNDNYINKERGMIDLKKILAVLVLAANITASIISAFLGIGLGR